MVSTIKFSQFANGGDLGNGNVTVGLDNTLTINTRFNNPWTFLPPGTTAQRPPPSVAINYRLRLNTDTQSYEFYDAVAGMWFELLDSGFTGVVILNPSADQTILNNHNLIMAVGSMIAPTMLPGNLSLTGNTLSATNSNGNIYVIPNGVGATQGLTFFGSTTPIGNDVDSAIQVTSINRGGAISIMTNWNANAGAGIYLSTSRSAVPGVLSPVTSSQILSQIVSRGDDGVTGLIEGSLIQTDVDGTVSSGIVPGRLNFYTSNLSGVRTLGLAIDSSQNLFSPNGGVIFGNLTGAISPAIGNFQVVSPGGQANILAESYVNLAGSAPTYWCYKSRSTTVGSFVAVHTNDTLGRMEFFGDDGTQFTQAADIVCTAVGTISNGVVPGRISIQTASSLGVLTQALVIDQNQLTTVVALASNSTIIAGSTIQATSAAVISGSVLGGITGEFVAYSIGASLGTLALQCANNAGNYSNVLINASTSAARTWTLPDATGTLALTSGIPSLGNYSFSGNTMTVSSGDMDFTLPSSNLLITGSSTQPQIGMISTDSGGSPYISFYRNTSSLLGLIQAGITSGVATGGTGMLYYNAIANAPHFFYSSGIFVTLAPTGNTISLGNLELTAGELHIGNAGGGGSQIIDIFSPTAAKGLLQFLSNDNAGNFFGRYTNASLTASRTWTMPDLTGTVAIPQSGTFTPVVSVGGSSVGITYGTQSGLYTLVGNVVTIQITLILTSLGGLTGTVSIDNLPFAAAGSYTTFPMYVTNMTLTGSPSNYFPGGTTSIQPGQIILGTFSNLTNSQVGNTSQFLISGSYLI